MKNMRFFRLATFIITFGKLFHSRARSPSSARLDSGRRFLPTMRQVNLPIEPYEILVKCFKNFVFPWFAREKERTTPVFQNSLFIGQFTDCFITARGKSKIETTGVSVKWIPINKEFVGSFF